MTRSLEEVPGQLGLWYRLMDFAFPLSRQTWDGPQPLFGLSSTSVGGNGDRDEAVQARKGGSWEGKISNSMEEALGPHCQGQTFLGMPAPAPTCSPSHLVDGWKRKWREILRSWVSLPTFSHILLSFPQ